MAVIPTGAIYKALIFDGESSRNYGVYITGEAVYNSPVRDVEMIKIPGRNGEFALDNGRFENIEVTYPAGIFADNEAYFAEAISDFRNFLASRIGYCRLEDEYNPNEYRMAVYKSGLNVDPAKLEAGEFSITFDCKPQRWLKDGETAVTIGEWGETETVSGDIVSVDNPNGILAVKSLEVDLEPIQDLNGYDKPWVGGAGKNLFYAEKTETSAGVSYTVGNDLSEVVVNGTSTGQTDCWLWNAGGNPASFFYLPNGEYTISVSGLQGDMRLIYSGSGRNGVPYAELKIADNNTKRTFTVTDGTQPFNYFVLRASAGQTFDTTVKIQIEAGSTATDWTPYSNICPISGHTSVDTNRTGKNLFDNGHLTRGLPATAIGSSIDSITTATRYSYWGFVPPKATFTVSNARYDDAFDALLFFGYKDGKLITYDPSLNEGTQTINGANYDYVRLCVGAVRGQSAPLDLAGHGYVQLELGSEATAYEPYQGTTYTTALGRTVYGGTLDVTSGVLTVDRAMVTYDGTEKWIRSSSALNGFYVNKPSDAKNHRPITTDKFDYTASSSIYFNNYGMCYTDYSMNFSVNPSTIGGITVDLWKAWLAENPLEVVYELATPQTYQLTAQQIDLLTDDNNIWSDSGAITLEYGQNPSVLFNPTLFESSPMLEVGGSGSIQFNGYEIEFAGIPYGEVVIADHMGYSSSSNPFTTTVTLDTSLLNTGDPIYLETKGCEIRATLKTSGSGYFRSVGLRNAPTNVLDTSTGISSNKKEAYLYMWPDFGEGFVYGTAKTLTCSAEYRYSVTSLVAYYEKVDVTIAYDGDDSVTVTISRSGTLEANTTRLRSSLSFPTMYGDSSKPNTAPIFIDCDLGEAYTNEGGVYRSMNQYIDLGSDLPTLGVGANEVTFDNTITELKVTPRWWKV